MTYKERSFYCVISRKLMENYEQYHKKLDRYLTSVLGQSNINFDPCQGYRLALLSCKRNFNGRFQSSLLTAKKKIAQLLQQKKMYLENNKIQILSQYLKYLVAQLSSLHNEGIVNVYIGLVNLSRVANNKEGVERQDSFRSIVKCIIKALTPLLLYYFVNKERNKRINSFNYCIRLSCSKISSVKNIRSQENQRKGYDKAGDHEQLLRQIEMEFSNMPMTKLISQYLKQQENSIIDSIQICRLCSKQIKLKNFQVHIKNCSKKSKIQSQLKSLEEGGKKLLEEVKIFQKTLMLKNTECTKRQLEMLKILRMLKDSFLSLKAKGSVMKRNTMANIRKNQIMQRIKKELKKFEEEFEKDDLLSKLVVNKEEMITAKGRLHMAQICSNGQDSSKTSDAGSFSSLQEFISRSMHVSSSGKTKKSIFASKIRDKQQHQHLYSQQQHSSNEDQQSQRSFCSSLSIERQKQQPPEAPESYSSHSSQSQKQMPTTKFFDLKKKNAFKHSIEIEKDDKSALSTKIVKSMRNVDHQNYIFESMGIEDFDILKSLGKGAFGKVYLVRRKRTKDLYALKHIALDHSQQSNQLQLIQNQHEIFKKIAGDHLIKAPFAFTEDFGHFFVLEFMPGGDLSKILNDEGYLEEKHAKFYLAQIVLALEYLHKCDIIHRDLKPQNIVIDKRGHIKLTDFGLSEIKIRNKIYKIKDKNKDDLQKGAVKEKSNRRVALINKTNSAKIIGTPDYIAPEIINQTSNSNHSIDWWSLGVMAYEMLVGCRPFSAMTVEEVLSNIIQGKIQWPQVGKDDGMMSPEAYDFIFRLLDKNFQRRLGNNSCQEIKRHLFFDGVDWEYIKKQKPPITPVNQLNLQREYGKLEADENLRLEIKNSRKKYQKKPKKLMGLQNFVRYDVLLQETYESVQQKMSKEKNKIQKIKEIGRYIEHEEKQNKIFVIEDKKQVNQLIKKCSKGNRNKK